MEFKQEIMPKHIGIIMDGNRRWAKQRGKPAIFGHTEGAKTRSAPTCSIKTQSASSVLG